MTPVQLDDPQSLRRLDASGMAGHIISLADQCKAAWDAAQAFSLPFSRKDVDKIVILGMGGSAIGGDLLAALARSAGRAPVLSHRDHGLPGYVDDRTLLIAQSYSGATEETLDGLELALKMNCRKLVITTGGEMKQTAESNGVPVFPIQYTSPPRAALGWSFLPLIAFAGRLALLPDQSAAVEETITLLQRIGKALGPGTLAKGNEAKTIAARLPGRVPAIFGEGPLAPVACRWKTQINENSKSWAIAESLPEACHNTVAGLGLSDSMRGQVTAIILADGTTTGRTAVRRQALRQVMERSGVEAVQVDARGDSLLARMMGLILLGDWTSYYLAMLNGVDPTPIPAIDFLKQAMQLPSR